MACIGYAIMFEMARRLGLRPTQILVSMSMQSSRLCRWMHMHAQMWHHRSFCAPLSLAWCLSLHTIDMSHVHGRCTPISYLMHVRRHDMRKLCLTFSWWQILYPKIDPFWQLFARHNADVFVTNIRASVRMAWLVTMQTCLWQNACECQDGFTAHNADVFVTNMRASVRMALLTCSWPTCVWVSGWLYRKGSLQLQSNYFTDKYSSIKYLQSCEIKHRLH